MISLPKYSEGSTYTPEIKIRYIDSPALEQKENSDWIDTYIAEDVSMQSGEFKLIPLGFACQLPDGYEAILVPRSSTFKRYGILQANSIGVIDNSFAGNDDIWLFPAYATRPVTILKGTRICQFRIQQKQPRVKFTKVENLSRDTRGGIGSTGV